MKLNKPTLLLDRKKCEANIRKMVVKAEDYGVELIPHFKTHQSAVVGEWFREAGVKAITVTSVKMAEYFATHGWKDITIAFPVNVLEIEQLNALAAQVDLKIFVNSQETANILKDQLNGPVKFYIEIDAGDGRSGVLVEDSEQINSILAVTRSANLHFIGFYTHPGHTYAAASANEVVEIATKVLEKLRALKSHFEKKFPKLKISTGDTPSSSIVTGFDGVDSIHPGNFVYYDLVQQKLGANTFEEIAICLAVPVVAVHHDRQEVIVHSGWTHQGKDSLADEKGNFHYGLVVHLKENDWTAPIPGARVDRISQEHGVLKLPQEVMKKAKVGDVLGILPVHACATSVMMGEIYTLEGEKIDMMPR